MTAKEKLEALERHLDELGINYKENHKSQFGITIDLKVMKYRVAVFISRGEEQDSTIIHSKNGRMKFQSVYRPVFVRESDTAEFLIEKCDNCIAKSKEIMARLPEIRRKKIEGRKENSRCWKRHLEKVKMWQERDAMRKAQQEEVERQRKAQEQIQVQPKRRRVVIRKYEPVSDRPAQSSTSSSNIS